MPYVNIKITKEGNVTPEQKRALIEGATNLLHDVQKQIYHRCHHRRG